MNLFTLFAMFLSFTVPTVPVQHQPRGQQRASESQSDAKSADSPSPSVTNNQATNYYQQQAPDKPQGWHKLVAWPEGITALAIVFTLGAIIWQAWETRGASIAARDAANAAKQSAEIAANSERAWLITDVTFSSNWPDISGQGGPVKSVMVINITNAGRSPAEIDGSSVVSLLVPKNWPLPEHPSYGEIEAVHEVDSIPGEIIPVDQTRSVFSYIQRFDLLTDLQITNIRTGALVLYCYGKILYTDNSPVQRLTQFGYLFYSRKDGSDAQPEGMYRIKSRNYNYTA